MLSPSQRSQRARLAAYQLHATHDSREITAAARTAFLARFVEQVDPDRVLPEKERQRRVNCARKAYFTKLALASAKARASRKRGEHRP